MPEITILDSFKGFLIPKDLLSTAGHMFCVVKTADVLSHSGFWFQVLDEKFVFAFSIFEGKLILQRNDIVLIYNVSNIDVKNEFVLLEISWKVDEIGISCDKKSVSAKSSAVPPQSLIKWARQQNLLPIVDYKSENDFVSKVFSCLASIQEKISAAGAVLPFWNVTYEGGKIKERSPKKEIEIHPIIHCLLSDQMLMSSIEVVPEYHTGVGNLDFMFLATIKDKGIAKMCVEFKNAHSTDVFNGLENQLPLYMKNCGAEFGAYCVLNYKGEWFDKPNISKNMLDTELKIRAGRLKHSHSPIENGIRTFIFDLAKPESASKA